MCVCVCVCGVCENTNTKHTVGIVARQQANVLTGSLYEVILWKVPIYNMWRTSLDERILKLTHHHLLPPSPPHLEG